MRSLIANNPNLREAFRLGADHAFESGLGDKCRSPYIYCRPHLSYMLGYCWTKYMLGRDDHLAFYHKAEDEMRTLVKIFNRMTDDG